MTAANEATFFLATKHAEAALAAAEKFPHGYYRAQARDNLKAAIGWIKQARDVWAAGDHE